MGRDEEEIKEKLAELEASLKEETEEQKPVSVAPKSTELALSEDSARSDFYMIAGFALLLTGVFMVLHHVQVGTGMMSWFGFGGQGFGLLLIPLLVGVGFLLYDYKNRFGWVITAASIAVVIFAILSQLVMWFPHMSLFGLLLMFLPFAGGGACIAKAMRARPKKAN